MERTYAGYITELRRDFTSYCEKELEQDNITLGLLYPIIYIAKHEGCTQKQLGESLFMDNGYVTRTLKKLESLQMIKRITNDDDKRIINLFLTDNGKSVFEKSRMLFKKWDDQVFSGINNKEKEQIMSLMQKIKESRRK